MGASAGGLEAFNQLLRGLPTDAGMAFVFLQHLDARHASHLPELLAKATTMPVTEVTHGQPLAPNHVYVMPPNVLLTLVDGMAVLAPRETSGLPFKPIDTFCQSLARARGSQAIGIILSGTGADGTLGLKAIKAEGGVTLAQEEATAQFRGMPQSAISAGVADFVLPPEAMGQKLAELVKHPYVRAPVPHGPEHEEALAPDPTVLRPVLALLQPRFGVDLSAYKAATLGRRLQRRVMLTGSESLEAYIELLHKQPAELDNLYEDFFIHVTSFFRDPPVYAALQSKIFPKLAKTRAAEMPVRLWVPGCSTGEEAYSLAMAWLEFVEGLAEYIPIQVFGSDISAAAIDTARAGRYPESAVSEMSADRLRRFFVKVPGGYQIAKRVRDLCVFAPHNLLSDPPFTQLDLLCCRNVLIYLQPPTQQRILHLAHYALRPTGYLVLGSSEDIGQLSDLFSVVDKQQRIYAKNPVPTQHWHVLSRLPQPIPQTVADRFGSRSPVGELVDPQMVFAAADRLALSKYVPASVIVNAQLDILEYRGRVGAFLEPHPGQPSRNLQKMVRPGLEAPVSSLVRQASKTNTGVKQGGVRLMLPEGRARRVTVEVTPFQVSTRSQEPYFLVAFVEETTVPLAPVAKTARGKASNLAGQLAQAEQALEDAQGAQQSLLQERDAYNQEMLAALEELQSTNEELQSTNEELQSAKEELQSTNEELTTLNEELENRNNELGQALGNLTNIVDSVRIPIIIIGGNLRIRLFNPAAERVLSIVATDIGRPIAEIKTRLSLADLEPLIREVMETLRPHDEEVQDREGRWYAMRIRPYKSLDNRIDGVVLTWTDISAVKGNLAVMTEAHDYLGAIVSTVRQALIVLDADLCVVTANRWYYELFQTTAAETERRSVYELGEGEWNIPELRQLLEEVLPQSSQFQGLEIERQFPLLGLRTMLLNARRVHPLQAQGELILLAIEDVTAIKQLTELQQLRQLSGRLQAAREDERGLLAREIHDELGSALTGLNMQVHQVRAALNDDQAGLQQTLSDMIALIEQELQYVRQVSARLRPHILDDLGLKAALEWQVSEFQKQTGVGATLRVAVEEDRLGPEIRTAVFRIVQEALTNVARHAQASTVGVTLEIVEAGLQVVIHDNGRGLPREGRAGKISNGLDGMRDRVNHLGGTFELWSEPGQGTSVRARLPLATPPQ